MCISFIVFDVLFTFISLMLLILFVSNTFADSSQITYATTLNSYFRYLFTELITRNFMDPLTVVGLIHRDIFDVFSRCMCVRAVRVCVVYSMIKCVVCFVLVSHGLFNSTYIMRQQRAYKIPFH